MVFNIPFELFLGFMGVSISLAIFGLARNPQIPAMIVFAGVFILVMAVSIDNIIMGQLVDKSASSGQSVTYTYKPDLFAFNALPKVLFTFIAAVMMLTGALMVSKA